MQCIDLPIVYAYALCKQMLNYAILGTFGIRHAQAEQLVIKYASNTGQGGWPSLTPLTFR